jgi:hypothetical protein
MNEIILGREKYIQRFDTIELAAATATAQE